jgi:hypothetical protein
MNANANSESRRAALLASIGIAPLVCAGTVSAQGTPSQSEGVAAWREVEAVITHPRCINCHTMTNYPRQGDERRRHDFRVVRGHEGKGAPGALCTTCHGTTNNRASGVPGASNWHLAPLSMAWEQAPGRVMDSASLCAALKSRARNGDRSPAQIIEHHAEEPLVLWAWQPGSRSEGTTRGEPPISHQRFVAATRAWADAGAPCP